MKNEKLNYINNKFGMFQTKVIINPPFEKVMSENDYIDEDETPTEYCNRKGLFQYTCRS